MANDERITFLEAQLKDAKCSAEECDRKYEEVSLVATVITRPSSHAKSIASTAYLTYYPTVLIRRLTFSLSKRFYVCSIGHYKPKFMSLHFIHSFIKFSHE